MSPLLSAAFSANGKDVIVDFPQQSHWTGLLSEMELVPSVHPGVRYASGISSLHCQHGMGSALVQAPVVDPF